MNLGFLPEFREMPLVAGHQVVRAGGIGALKKYVVIQISCHLKPPSRADAICAVCDELEELLTNALADVHF